MQRVAPGGPFDQEREMPPATRAALESEWRLDKPLVQQFGGYVGDLCQFPPDLKNSMIQPDFKVMEIIAPRLVVSVSLGIATLLFALAVGIPLGLMAALQRRRFPDHMAMLVALLGISIPSFVLGPALKWIFALELDWLPESRWVGPANMVLPVLSLSAVYIATVARMVRAGMIEVLDEDYIRTARAKGLSPLRVVLRHALPGAIMPIVSWLGPAAAGLAVGSVVIERVFNIPGLGNTFVDAAFNRDYTLVMGTVLVYSSLLIVANLGADLLLAFLDPRTRSERS